MIESELQALLDRMSIAEKALQLYQIDMATYLQRFASATGPSSELGLADDRLYLVGSIVCGGNTDAEEFAALQERFRERSPNHIPTLIMSDVIHGMRTIFPIPLAMACSFSTEVAERMARVSAMEAAASGIHVTFAPMADVARDPRWGRCMESAGESPLVCGEMAAAAVRGFHGGGEERNDAIACCAKHFAGYGLVEAGREYAPTDVSYTELYNTYFPSFREAIREGCDMVMPAFTPIDRMPAVCNRRLLKTVLREQWGFRGVTISDWGSAEELIVHGLAEDRTQAAELAFLAGNDVDMMGFVYSSGLEKLVQEHVVSMRELDEAVMRMLRLKNALGLFETKNKNASREVQQKICSEPIHRRDALEAALKSCVLLQNDGVLPLQAGARIALVGDKADAHDLIGAWAAGGSEDETPSLRDVLGKAAVDADSADVIVFATGERSAEVGEAASKVNPSLTQAQMDELKRVRALGKRVVVVLFCGRPMILTDVLPLCDALLLAWFPGSEGAQAVWQLLSGKRNPSGHLSITFPRSVGQIPIHHDALTNGRPNRHDPNNFYVSRYLDERNEPLFPFGFGLSYTRFSVEDVRVSRSTMRKGEAMEVTALVSNTGDCSGETVLQLYLACEHSPILHPQRRLAAFERVHLHRGETRCVAFRITEKELALYDAQGNALRFTGRYGVAVGENAQAQLQTHFTYHA